MHRWSFLLILFPTVVFGQAPGAAIDVAAYTFALTLSDASDEIEGEALMKITFLDDGVAAFGLDLIGQATPDAATGMMVETVLEDGAPVPFTHTADRLEIRPNGTPEAGAARVYTVRYRGTPADGLIIDQNKHGERTFFGDNWPNRARHWLPAVDHPGDKAPVAFVVVAPAHYQVVGPGRLVEETDLGDGRRRTHWHTDAPLATKVMVIGVARFAVEHLPAVEGIPVQSWVYPQDREAGFYDFARARRILDFFEDKLGPYPYEKLASVQSKTRYGGMENASNIFYNENSVTGTRANEGLQAHEIAHQWFGDGVSEADWPHLWLSEGFATYLTQLYFEFTYGRDRLDAGMAAARERVAAFHARSPDEPVVDTVYASPLELLNTNAYQKGAWVLHMLRHHIGDEAFWEGLRLFYRRHRDANATSADFRRAMEAASGMDLRPFFRQWLRRPGHPRLVGTWHYDEAAGALVIMLRQTQPEAFAVPVEVGIVRDAGALPAVETLELDAPEKTFTLPIDAAPAAVVLDPRVILLHEADFGPRGG